jgi:diguanylate cyclase (GGDEF)-like protein
MMPYEKTQPLNATVDMLQEIYGLTQNYSKSSYELFSHLTEVTGAFGKFALKQLQPERAIEFVPKMFAWAAALLKNVKGRTANLEEIILTKYPRVCPYCGTSPCGCWSSVKPRLDSDRLREVFYRTAAMQRRSANDFQMMFAAIYEASWGIASAQSESEIRNGMRVLHSRIVEELSELGETIRFYHLYPSNFDNELADYMAWWFAIVNSMHRLGIGRGQQLLAEDLLWAAYPGYCTICGLSPCDCRPGPVRELLSKPSLLELAFTDALTQAGNRADFDRWIAEIELGRRPIAYPLACIRVDIDDFKKVNDFYSHAVGDEALKHLVNVLRQRARARDRICRVGGDEFAVLCQDLSGREAVGMMERVATALKERRLTGRVTDKTYEIALSLSIGVAVCRDGREIRTAFERADHAAIDSKRAGKDLITFVE